MWVVKAPNENVCSGISWYDYIYSKGGAKSVCGCTGKLRMVVFKLQGHGLLQMWNNRGQFEGSGLKAQEMRFFVLSKHCVSSWFSMLVEEWGAAQATLTEGFPSWWILRRTRHPKSLSSVFMETMKHHPPFYHNQVNWKSRHILI